MGVERRGARVWLWMFLGAMAVLGVGRWRFSAQAAGFTPVAQRRAAGDLRLPQLGGGEWRLADHPGQVVLMNYWATWCEPCREELPGLVRVSRESDPKKLAMVGVSLDTGADVQGKVQRFVTRYRVPYPVAFPDDSWHGQMQFGIPKTVLLDRHGRVAKIYTGAVEREDFEKDIAALLAES